MDNSSNPSTTTSTNSNKFNLKLCIDYRKLNSCFVTARQIKADGSLGKVISNCSPPTIDNLIVRSNRCKFFSTTDLRSGYYHIHVTEDTTEKTAFIMNKGKWIFHSLPFDINNDPLAISYVLGKVLASCTEFTLNYLNNFMIFSTTSKEHLKAGFK